MHSIPPFQSQIIILTTAAHLIEEPQTGVVTTTEFNSDDMKECWGEAASNELEVQIQSNQS